VLLVAAALAVGGLLIVQRAAATKPCKQHSVALTVSGRTLAAGGHGKRLCVRVPKVRSGDAARRAFAVRLLVDPALATGVVRRALGSARGRKQRNKLRRRLLNALAPVARAARPIETSTTTVDGVTTKQTLTGHDPDELGSGVSTVMSGKAAGRGEDHAFVKRCPSAEGKVPGERRYLVTTSFTVETMGKRIDVTEQLGWEAKLEAHVGDDARLKDFRYDATGHFEFSAAVYSSTGRFIARQPTRVFRWVITREGIDPRHPGVSAEDFIRSVKWNARGPKGSTFDAQDSEAIVKGVVLTEQDLAERGSSLYLQAEQSWYDRAECLKAEFDPASLDGDGGQSFGVDTRVRQVFEKVEVDIRLKAEVGYEPGGCPGGVSPGEADAKVGAPAHFTYTAASDCGDSETWPDKMRVEGVSKRGRVIDLLSGTFKRLRMPKAYVGTVSGTADNGESWEVTGVTYNQAGRVDLYELAAGGATWQLHLEQSGCTSTAGPAQFSASPNSSDGYDNGTTKPAGGIGWDLHSGSPRYYAYGTWGKQITAHMSCPPDFALDFPYDVEPWWFSTQETEANTTTYRTADPNSNLQGTATGTWSGAHITWTWSLAPRY
jgi:hypothetical protein